MAHVHVSVGQKVQFDPLIYCKGFGSEMNRGIVTGTVVAVYEDHKWFSVEYGQNQRTSFKFTDIGKVVTVVG